ncbi:MAG: cytochrome c oxidase subunit II [Candidatus Dadabacteria bacterium]|nr:MAG: cytochrome c oxidase subunit II [Candidatus Dadabacteria bacterium]
MFNYLPEQASEFAYKVDRVNQFITNTSVFFIVLICGAMLYFAFRYRKRPGETDETPRIEGNNYLEVVWTAVPAIISIYVMYIGIVTFREMRTVEPDALEVNVTAQKWKWDFEYQNGKKTTAEATIPVDKPVKFILASRDVIHSFFVPAMRVKMDAVPGMYTYVTFKPIKTGTYNIFCTEYCGTGHSAMLAKLRVVSEAEFERWLNDNSEELLKAQMSPAERGENLYNKSGCVACHSLDGSRRVGPSFLKLFGKKEALADGSEVTADENYIKESILNPNAKVVKGFPPNQMPAFEGQLTDDDISALIAFIKAQDGTRKAEEKKESKPQAEEKKVDLASLSPAERGKLLFQEMGCNACHSLDGSRLVGPSFKGLFGRNGKLTDGSSYTADEKYIKHSILEPTSQVVEGYPPAMPTFKGRLNDSQINDLIEFIKTLK